MNNGTSETLPPSRSSSVRSSAGTDELTQAKKDLLQAEVRLAKARATVVTAEIDIKVINARLRSLAK